MNLGLEGKVAIVTGASRGIGAEISEELRSLGCRVVGTTRSPIVRTPRFVPELTEWGSEGWLRTLDMLNEQTFPAFIEDIITQYGQLDIIVNNAGITADGPLKRMSLKDFDDVVNTKVRSVFSLLQAASGALIKSKAGRIVNISSISGLHGHRWQINYCAANAGLIGLTKGFAKELGAKGVTCNAICPGFIRTAMTAQLSEDKVNQYIDQTPVGRVGTPSDISGLVAFLCSNRASFINGEVITVDGGLTM